MATETDKEAKDAEPFPKLDRDDPPPPYEKITEGGEPLSKEPDKKKARE
jgi:hypothetical protein